MKLLEGKIALITGASRGIGRGIAKAFAAQGADVAFTYLSSVEKGQALEAELAAEGIRAKGYRSDASDFEQAQALVDEVIKDFGRIDILVNNAGGYPKEIYEGREHQAIRLWEWSEGQWDQIIRTNLRIPFLCMKHILPVMIRQGSGKVVSVSSRMGRIASQMGAYAVAKGGIVTMTKTAAIQTKEYGIQVNAVAPGIVDTPGQRVYNHSVGQDDVKMGSAEDVANAILYLLCDAPDVMTGQCIDLFTTT